MKIVFLHPYGKLGDNNHRLKRQIELMGQKADVLEIGRLINSERGLSHSDLEDTWSKIKDFKPDLLYVNGYLLERYARDLKFPYVYDMGSFVSRNLLIKMRGLDVSEMLKQNDRDLQWILGTRPESFDAWQRERIILKEAKAIIGWESDETILIEKLFGKEIRNKVKEISMIFSDIPEPVYFENKEKRIIAIASNWGAIENNGGFLTNISKEVGIEIVGKGLGRGYMQRKDLLDYMNNSRVIFCPYKAGGCNIVSDALRLGCNVVAMEYYPFKVYLSKSLISAKGNVAFNLEAAKAVSFPIEKNIPTEEEQLNKILEICKSII